MTDLEKLRAWLDTFPGRARLKSYYIDYTDAAPDSGGIRPQGLSQRGLRRDITGGLTVENRYTFGLYYVLAKSPGDDAGAGENAEFLLDLQNWVRDQSAAGLVPAFGDEPALETAQAGGGTLYASDEEGLATYRATLTIDFVKKYKEDPLWKN